MSHAHEIVDGIYLGNHVAALDPSFLAKHKIQLVVNCTKDIPFDNTFASIEHYRVPVDDKLAHEDSEKLLHLMPMILQKILSSRYNRGNVLVHCYAGIQRSATVVACLLMFTMNLSAKQSITYIRNIRPVAFTPSANFHYTLNHFQNEVQRL
jgi:dual specificity MAP kinase phosphatase